MKQIRFTITEEEIKEIAKDIEIKDLSNKQVKSILDMVECDEMLWKDIRNSIINSIHELFI